VAYKIATKLTPLKILTQKKITQTSSANSEQTFRNRKFLGVKRTNIYFLKTKKTRSLSVSIV